MKLHTNAPHKLKLKLLQNAKALLFPSKMGEPFGLVACEAMAVGTPPICLRDGAIPEVVKDGETGFICKNEDEMIKAVKRVDKINPEDCRKRVEKHFSRETMTNSYLKLYNSILEGTEW